MKKVLIFVLCAVFALSFVLTSCTGQSEPSSTGSTTATGSSAVNASEDNVLTPFSPYADTVKLTVARIMNRGAQLAPGETTSKNGQLDVIKKKLNVEFEIAWETAPGEYNQKLSLSIAGGTLPDVFVIQDDNVPTFRALAENNQLADLTEAYKNCIGGLALENLQKVNFQNQAPVTVDGKIFGISGIADGYNYNTLWIRKDWLDKVGMPAPKTLDDLKAVATAFVKNKLGGPNTLGLPLTPQGFMGESYVFFSSSPICNAVGSYPKSWIKGADGKVVYGSVAPETKEALRIMADWYASGLLDPQFMTYKTVDDVTPRVRNNEAGMMFVAWWNPYVWLPETAKYDYDWVPVLAPLNAEGKFEHINPMYGAGGCVVVNKKCAHPEAVVKAMNVEYEAYNGQYDSDPEILAMLKPSRDASASGRTISPFSGFWISNDFFKTPKLGHAISKYCETGDESLMAPFTPADLDNAKKAAVFYKSKDRKDQASYAAYQSYAVGASILDAPENVDIPLAFSGVTDSMSEFWPNLTTLEQQAFAEIISGQKPVDYFDDFVKQWKQGGGDRITSEVQAIVDSQ